MLLLFAGIIAGVIIGIGGSALFLAFRVMWEDEPADCEWDDLMADIQPDGTPFLSEIEKHRAKHMAAMGKGGG